MMDSVEILVFICLIHIIISKGGGGNTETISIFNRTALQRGCHKSGRSGAVSIRAADHGGKY